jgi:hypothetical protein
MDLTLKTEIDEFVKQYRNTTTNLRSPAKKGFSTHKKKLRQRANTLSTMLKSFSESLNSASVADTVCSGEAKTVQALLDNELISCFVQAFTFLTSTDSTLTENTLFFLETVLKLEAIDVNSGHFASLLTEVYGLIINREKDINQQPSKHVRAYMQYLTMLERYMESDFDMGQLGPYSVTAIHHFEKIKKTYNTKEGDSQSKTSTSGGKKSGGSHRTAADGWQGENLPDLQELIILFNEFQKKWVQLLKGQIEGPSGSSKTSPTIWKTSSDTVACLLSTEVIDHVHDLSAAQLLSIVLTRGELTESEFQDPKNCVAEAACLKLLQYSTLPDAELRNGSNQQTLRILLHCLFLADMKGWTLFSKYGKKKHEQSTSDNTVTGFGPQLLCALSKLSTSGDQMSSVIALHLAYRLLKGPEYGFPPDDVYQLLDTYAECMDDEFQVLKLLIVRVLTELLSSSLVEAQKIQLLPERHDELLARLLSNITKYFKELVNDQSDVFLKPSLILPSAPSEIKDLVWQTPELEPATAHEFRLWARVGHTF